MVAGRGAAGAADGGGSEMGGTVGEVVLTRTGRPGYHLLKRFRAPLNQFSLPESARVMVYRQLRPWHDSTDSTNCGSRMARKLDLSETAGDNPWRRR